MNTTTTIEKMIDSIDAVCIDLGLRGGYTPEEITDLVCDIAFAHMYDALRDRAETVYRLFLPLPSTISALPQRRGHLPVWLPLCEPARCPCPRRYVPCTQSARCYPS